MQCPQSTATSGGVFPVRAPASSNLGTREPAVNGRQAQIWQVRLAIGVSVSVQRDARRGAVLPKCRVGMPLTQREYSRVWSVYRWWVEMPGFDFDFHSMTAALCFAVQH